MGACVAVAYGPAAHGTGAYGAGADGAVHVR